MVSGSCAFTRLILPFSSTLLFLSIILPPSSFAQLTLSSSSNTASSPTALWNSITTPSSTSSAASPTQPLPPTSTATIAAGSDGNEIPVRIFNYYFLIIAFFVITLCIIILYLGRRKKRKAAFNRYNRHQALARDLELWRPSLGAAGHWRTGSGSLWRNERIEGLDERGEAPPPYVPGSKPPSISGEEMVGNGNSGVEVGEALELVRSGNGLLSYHDSRGSEQGNSGISRPATAVTASPRLAGFISDARSSSEAKMEGGFLA